MSDIFEGLLVTGERRGEKECQFLRYKVQLYAGAPAYSIRTIKMSHGSVKKKKKEVTLLPQFPPHQLLELEYASKSTGELIKMQTWIQQSRAGA